MHDIHENQFDRAPQLFAPGDKLIEKNRVKITGEIIHLLNWGKINISLALLRIKFNMLSKRSAFSSCFFGPSQICFQQNRTSDSFYTALSPCVFGLVAIFAFPRFLVLFCSANGTENLHHQLAELFFFNTQQTHLLEY